MMNKLATEITLLTSAVRETFSSVARYDKSLLAITAGLILTGVAVPFVEILVPNTAVGLLLEGAGMRAAALRMGVLMALAAGLWFLREFLLSQRTWRLSYLTQGCAHDLMTKNLSCRYSHALRADTQALYAQLRQMSDSPATNCYTLSMLALTDIAVGLLGFLLYGALLGRLHLWAVPLLVATSLIHFLVMRAASRYEHRMKARTAQQDKRLEYLFQATTDPAGAKDVRLYRAKGWLLEKLAALSQIREGYDRKKLTALFSARSACALAAFLRDGGAYLLFLTMALDGRLGLDQFILAMGAVRGLSAFLLKVLDGVVRLSSAALHLRDIRAFAAGGAVTPPAQPLPAAHLQKPVSIEFQDVSFSYPQGKQIFDRFSLRVEPGEKIALVGLNGAGKTTLVNLLCGLFQPDEGKILLDGYDISRFPQEELFSLFAPVFQDCFLLPAPLRDNIAPQSPEDDRRIWDCLRRAGLKKDLDDMGRDLDAPVTRVAYQDGLAFSGGQEQKLYLARMLYKDAPIALLDEPTSALDPLAERQVYEQYASFVEGRTSIFISHRLASTRFCDRVLLLEDGAIVEEGTHDQLMARQGAYQRLFDVQSRYYREGGEAAYG